jgi:hypothetical protein
MKQDYLKIIDILDKPFETGVFDKLVVLYDNKGEFATLLLDRTKLNLKRRKMTDTMLRDITKLFYEMVFKKSPAWQNTRKSFEDEILAFIEGEEKIITLPPNKKTEESKIYLHTGEGVVQSFFKGEKRFMETFVDKTVEVIAEFAIQLGFRVVAFDTELLDKIVHGYGVSLNFSLYSNGFVTVGYEALDDDWNESDEWFWYWDDELLEPLEKRGDCDD